jgi:acetyl esterase/lipase
LKTSLLFMKIGNMKKQVCTLQSAVLLVLLALCLVTKAHAQETILLWPDDPALSSPGRMGVSQTEGGKTRVTEIGTPHLMTYIAKNADGPTPAVILCPGGGYRKLVPSIHWPIAEWLNEKGISAFILMYRCPSSRSKGDAVPDAQRAIRLVRSRAEEWNIDPDRVGVLGTSAGGNLAARMSLAGGSEYYSPASPIDELRAKPDFAILMYPAYLAHRETGELADWIEIPEDMPPTMIISARDDKKHFPNSPAYEAALRKAGASVRSLYFDEGGHGFSLRTPSSVSIWPEEALEWLKETKVLPRH